MSQRSFFSSKPGSELVMTEEQMNIHNLMEQMKGFQRVVLSLQGTQQASDGTCRELSSRMLSMGVDLSRMSKRLEAIEVKQ